MRNLRRTLLCTLFLSLIFLQKTNAQNWENPGSTPSYPIAYDQDGLNRTVVTTHNVYHSSDDGNTWQSKLSAANAPFLTNDNLSSPAGVEGKFQGFIADRTDVFGDVLFLTANMGPSFSSSNWKMYSSIDGGNTLTEIFADDDPYSSTTNFGYRHELSQVDANTYVIGFVSNSSGPSFSKTRYYVSNDQGQSWNFLFQYDSQDISFAGTSTSTFAFLAGDEIIYRDKITGLSGGILSLPEACQAATQDEQLIRLVTWTEDSGELRGYKSTNGGGSFTSYAVSTSNSDFDEAQIFGDLVFASGGGFGFQSKTIRTSFANWSNAVNVSAAGNYQDYFPYRITSDGQMANLLPGTKPHTVNIFSDNDGAFFNAPFEVSSNNWTSHSTAEKPKFALDAIPEYNGKWLRFAGSSAWTTTDGADWTKSFGLANGAWDVRYFEGATHVYSNSITASYTLTNDGETVVSNEPYVVGAGSDLYFMEGTPFEPLGIYKSTDQGETFNLENDGWFWGRGAAQSVWGDDVTGTFYSLELEPVTSPGNEYNFIMSKSNDQGQSWEILSGANLPSTNQEDWAYNKFKPFVVYNNYFFMKNDTELHYSTDGGASFQTVNNLPFELGGSEMYRLGGYLCFRTGAEQFYRVNINDWLGAGGGGVLSGDQIDISLSVSMNPPNPAVWANFDITYTITNNSSIPATRITLNSFIASSSDAIQQGGTSVDYVNLTPNGFFGRDLPAGETGTIIYHYFRTNGAMPQPWGQLAGYREPDVDSRPNNADWPEVNEDDEAIVGGGPSCAISINTFLDDCDNNGTPGNDSDDLFGFTLAATNPVPGTGYQVFIPELGQTFSGTYGASLVFENLEISAGDLTLNLTDNLTGGCTGSATVEAPDPCSGTFGCTITASVAEVTCSDWGTPSDPSDDRYLVRFDVNKDGPCGSSYRVNNEPALGNYGANGPNYGYYPISSGQTTFTISDVDDPQYFTTVIVTPPAPCSGGSNPCSPDVTDPIISGCPSNISQTTTGTVATVNWTAPTASDACPGTVNLIGTHSPGSSFSLGTTPVTYTATDASNNSATCSFNVTVSQQGSGDIDLELSLAQPNASPTQWGSYAVIATLTNTGGQTATGVKLDFQKPDGVVYTGGNEFDASQGSFNPWSNEVWTVGSIPAGGSATLEVNYFLLVSGAPVAYAQVSAANETDADSTPGNGTSPTPNEDDEANTTGGGGPDLCEVMQTNTNNVQCDNAGTNSNPSDDTWTFDLTVNLAGTGCTGTNWTIPGEASGSYGSPTQMGPYPISAGSQTFTAVQVGNTSISKTFTASPPAPCSTGGGGQADLTISNIDISNSPVDAGQVLNFDFDLANNGTAGVLGNFTVKSYISTDNVLSGDDIQDGTIQTGNYPVGLSESNILGGATIPSNLAPGTYYLIAKVDADNQVSESNEGNNTVSASFTVSGGGGGGDIDLSLSMSAAPMNPTIYSTTEVTLTISNAGPQSATGVVVEFPKPDGTVYSGGSEWDATQGSFNPFGNERWTVGSIPAGGSESITVSYFLLSADALTPYAQVQNANETDGDSSPGNGTCCSPNEDDEAGLTLNSFAGGSSAFATPEMLGRPLRLLNVFPNPVYHGEVNLKIASQEERQEVLEIYDAFGRLAYRQVIDLQQGFNVLNVDISDFRSGAYQIVIPGHNLRNMPRTVIVERW